MKKTIIATIAALTVAPSIALAKDPSQTHLTCNLAAQLPSKS